MKNITKVLAAVVAGLTAVLQIPVVSTAVINFFGSHPTISSLFGGLAAILALLHVPNSPAEPTK